MSASSFFQSAAGGTALGALIGGAFSMGGAALSKKYARQEYDHQMASQYDYQKLYNQMARDESQFYWEKYQSPQAQMQAFADAGLNPNLIYGQNASMTPQSYKAPNASEMSFRDPLSGLAPIVQNAITQYIALENNRRQDEILRNQTAETIAKIDKMKADTNLTKENTLLTQLRQRQQELENQLAQETNPLKVQMLYSRIRLLDEQSKEVVRRTESYDERLGIDYLNYLLRQAQFEWNKDPLRNANPMLRLVMKALGIDDSDGLKKDIDSIKRKVERYLPSSEPTRGGGAGAEY